MNLSNHYSNLKIVYHSIIFKDVSILTEIRADIRNLEIELDKVMPGPVDGKIRFCGKMLKYTCKLESIKSALDRLESRKNTLTMWILTIMFESKNRVSDQLTKQRFSK